MQPINVSNSTIDPFILTGFDDKKIKASVLRLDKIHPIISGNKWFKLRYYLEDLARTGKKRVVTFGGAWSNHLVATAALCKLNGIDCIGIVRGEQPSILSATLAQAKDMSMKLIFISRDDFRLKKLPLELLNTDAYTINEGGYGPLGAQGAASIYELIEARNYTHICCAAATGTMIAGLIHGAMPGQQVIGISVLKNKDELEKNVSDLLESPGKAFQFNHNYTFGGYARKDHSLISFMNDVYRQTGVPSDFVYTGKLFFAVNDLVKNNFFPVGSHILIIHSGGLQGNASLSKGTLIF